MKRLLVIVDLQKDFVSGSLAAEGAEAALENARALIARERARGSEVVFTRDTHQSDYLSTQEGRLLPVEHCIEGTEGVAFADGVDVGDAKIFCKNTFGSTALGEYARKEGFEEILLAGICTDICVISNALLLKAFCPEAKISVIASACAGTTKGNHDAALAVMKGCQIFVE